MLKPNIFKNSMNWWHIFPLQDLHYLSQLGTIRVSFYVKWLSENWCSAVCQIHIRNPTYNILYSIIHLERIYFLHASLIRSLPSPCLSVVTVPAPPLLMLNLLLLFHTILSVSQWCSLYLISKLGTHVTGRLSPALFLSSSLMSTWDSQPLPL